MSNTYREQTPWVWRESLGIERANWLVVLFVALMMGAVCGMGIVASSWSITYVIGMTAGAFAVPLVLIRVYKLFNGDAFRLGKYTE